MERHSTFKGSFATYSGAFTSSQLSFLSGNRIFTFALMILLWMMSVQVSAQVSVTATAGTAGPTPYTTVKEAFDAINAGTHQGDITIALTASTTETATAVLNASGSGSALYTSVGISPSGGTAVTVSGAITAGSPLIDLNGADNVTINGLNTGGNSLTISNTTASATSGTSTIRFIGGATLNTVVNCSVLGSFSGSVATNGGNIFFSTDANTANGNDNNTISVCNIGPAGSNLPTKGIYGNGSTSTTAIGNSGNIIDSNNIFDFFGVAVTSSGIAVAGGCNTWAITNNRIYQTGTRTWTTGATHRGIELNSTTSTSGIQGFTVTGNIIGYASNTQTGTYTLTGSTGKFQGIFFNGITGGSFSDINNNTVAAVSMAGVTSSGTSTSTPFAGIYINNGLANSNNNTIGSQSATGSLILSTTTTSSTDVYGFYNFSLDDWTANNNNIGGISATNAGASGTFIIYGMRANTSTSKVFNATGNNVGGTVANSIQLTATGTSSQVIGMLTSNAIATWTSNTVRNLTSNIGTGTTTSASVIGMSLTTTSVNQNVSQNTIYGLSNTNTTAASVVTGIQFTGSSANLVQRNLIYGLSVATTSTAAEVNGIRVAGGTTNYRNNMIRIGAGIDNAIGTGSTTGGVNGINGALGTDNFYHNSVYIGGTPTAGVGPSYAFNSAQTVNTRSFRNNIFFNARSNSGATGKNYIVRVGGSTPNPTGLTINNNVYFSSGTGAVFGYFNSADVADLAAWQVAVGQDANSFFSNPQFIDPAGTTPDLHISPSTPTDVESGGIDLGVTDDFDGQTRASLTPTDVGADAGNFTAINTCSGTPTAGTTNATSTMVCAGVSFTLSLTGASSGAGITYQWQSSPDSVTYSNINGATGGTYMTSITASTWYQCIVTCTNSNMSATSTPVQVTLNTLLQCYCATSYTNGCSTDAITNVNLDGSPVMTNATGCAAGSYTYFTPTPTTTLTAGNTYNLALTFGPDGNQYSAAWIDYNQDGVLDASENIGISGNAGANGTITLMFTVPANATPGLTRLRIRGGNDSALTATQACGVSSSGFGETEDYDITIAASTACTGTPAPGNTTASVNPVCSGSTTVLGFSGVITSSGIIYQWQSSLDNVTYSNINGADAATYTATVTAATWYQCIVTCTNSNMSATSTPVQVTLETNPCICSAYCTPASDGGACVTNVTFNTINNTTAGCSPTNYSFESATTSVEAGLSYNLTLTTDESAITSVWIDYNQDGTFDASEWAQVYTTGTTGTISVLIPFAATVGNTRMRIRSRLTGNPNGSGDACASFGSGEAEDYCITILAGTNCTGTPAPGNTVSSANPGCSGVDFTLSLANSPLPGSGITYQWQSSPNNVSYGDITGETNPTLTTSQTAATWYQCVVTCTNSNQSAPSTPVQVTLNSPLQCYCATSYANGCGLGDEITNVTLNGAPALTNATGCGTGAYTYFTPTPTTTLTAGSSYTLSISFGADGNQFAGAWIDYNLNGVLEASENIGLSTVTAGASGTVNFIFTVPVNATPGLTRLRIRGGNDSALLATQACGTSSSGFGETEDYDITIEAGTACAGTPAPGNTTASVNPVCSGSTTLLGFSGVITSSGITYQWQSSSDNVNYSNINGATAATYTATVTASTWYQCVVTCTNSSQSATSTPVQVTLNVPTNCYCTAGATSTSFEKISNVLFNTIDNPSTSTAGYEDFTAVSTTVNKGSAYTFTGTISNPFSGDQIIVWIDYNQDGDFTDPGEEVFVSPTGNGPHSGSITIPATAATGTTRMRVRLHDTGATTPNATPCGTSSFGQVEDYTITIAGAACPSTLMVNSIPILDGTYLAAMDITSTGTVPATGNVIFGAFNSVELQPNFEVVLGGVFEIVLTGCSNN